ncbi:hypothetical protein I4U23_027460 [Adineta vaga]|nr:hypothetical protein I4U23_027460 [Adineta vaga]
MDRGLPSRASNPSKLPDKIDSSIGQWRNEIESAAEKTGVPASIIGGVLYQESRGRAGVNATQNQQQGRDTGLMQINNRTFQDMKQKHSNDFEGLSGHEENILAGAHYLQENYEKFGSWDLARRAYNSGPNAVVTSDANKIDPQYPYGDPDYITQTDKWINAISNGKPLGP